MVRIAILQTNPIFGDIKKNIGDTISMMETVDADLFVLPELFNTGYNFIDAKEVDRLSEHSLGFTYQILSSFTKKKNCFIVYGFAEKDNQHFYNSASLVGPSGLIGIYRKVHLYYREHLFFTPGNLGFPVFQIPLGKVGIMICFDWMFPEAARSLAIQGAQLIVHPANLVMPYCPDAMVTRCLENRVFSATANRVGCENRGNVDLTFIGKSEIVTPKGEILIRLSDNEVGIAVQEVNLEMAKDKQINKFNNLFGERKPEYYKLS